MPLPQPPPPSQPHALAAAATSGDRPALATLWRDHRRFVAAILLSHGASTPDLDDLLQDVAVTLCRQIHTLRDPARFLPWLRAVAINTATTAARRDHRARRALRPLTPHDLDRPDLRAGDAILADGRRVLEIALRLHPDYREPFLLRCIQGFSQRQIAEALEMNETTVETRLVRARRMLRRELSGARDDDLDARERAELRSPLTGTRGDS